MRVHILVLNYSGRRLLSECLPSVLEAARASRNLCDVAVIDNDSRDVSVAWLGEHFPQVRVICRPNRGLCSFNDVIASLEGPVAVLLNNDIKLERGCIDPLVEPLLAPVSPEGSPCFMTAPLCWHFDGGYEGFRTAVRWRWGLVQATALFPGHEDAIRQRGWTASAGAAMAVDCRRFVELGGFDPMYLPGRLEDLDFAFRGYLAGYHARYVPAAVAWHRGMATFKTVYGQAGCDALALRNTLLFQWKNLRTPGSLLRQAAGLPLRLAWDLLRAPLVPRPRRWAFARAMLGALARVGCVRNAAYRTTGDRRREREFFDRFHPARLAGSPRCDPVDDGPAAADGRSDDAVVEREETHKIIEIAA
jgi:N-acetylglucosaminyl-diphospho-decaprenol L-rhamnosyltransferase